MHVHDVCVLVDFVCTAGVKENGCAKDHKFMFKKLFLSVKMLAN